MLKKKRIWMPAVVVLILVITYLLGPVPPTPVYSEDWPEVPGDLERLDKYITAREDSLPVRDDNQARIIWNDSIIKVTEYSFVYLHGFAGSYMDGYPLNVNVADTFGANIYLARWEGHGLKPPATLNNFSPETAWASVKEALAIGHKIGEKVIVISTSTGGTMGIFLASCYPDSVHALINLSPNIKDDQRGTFLLNSPWGYEIAHLVSFGSNQKIEHQKEIATQYWDTIYPAEALIDLQVLVASTMKPETYDNIDIPILTLYYHKSFLLEDEHVEVDVYPEVHRQFATPDSMLELISLKTPGTHFIGSDIKSDDWKTAQQKVIEFCLNKLNMKLSKEMQADSL